MASFLGIEIAPDVVRGAIVKTALRRVTVARYIEVPVRDDESPVLPSPLDEPTGTSAPSDPVARAIRRLLDIAEVPASMTVCALPGEDASVRRIELPAAAARKLDELLPLEMELIVPFDPDETILDHQPISSADAVLRVLVVTAPKDRVRDRLAELARLGLDPVELGPGAASLDGLVYTVPALAAQGTHCLLSIGAHRTDIAFFVGGKVEFARTVAVGASELGASGSRTGTDRWIRELKQTSASWRIQNGSPIGTVFLAGGGAESEAVAAIVGETLGQPPVMLELPDSAPQSSVLTPAQRAAFAFALALASRAASRNKHVDLRKGEFVAKRTMSALALHAPVFAACAAIIVLSFLFATYAKYSVLASRRVALEDQLAMMTRERLGLETRSLTQARTLLQTGLGRRDPLPQFTAYDALAAVSQAIPEGVTHDVQRLRIDLGDDRSDGHVELAGMLSSAEELDQVTQAMRDVSCFREVDVGPLTGAGERSSYRIEADLKCPGPDGEAEPATRRRSTRARGEGN